MVEITDINDSKISEFVTLRQSALDEKYVVVESKNVLKKLFEMKIKIHKIFSNNQNLEFVNKYCTNIDFPIYTASNEIMKDIVGYKIHQGMMAVIDKPRYVDFDDISGNIIVLNGLTSPENVGSIVRSCAAFNIDSLIIDEKTCSPFIRRCIRVSTGNLFNIKVYKSTELEKDLMTLKNRGYNIISTANSKDAISLHNYTFPNNSAVVIGHEGHGVSQEIFDLSNNIIKININEEVTSLNAAIATSIILYHMTIK